MNKVAKDHGHEWGYVSILGYSYMQPIARLWEYLLSLNGKPSEVQAGPIENGYSASAILLSVVCLESIIARTKYIMLERGEANTAEVENKSCLDFYSAKFENKKLSSEMRELFVIRDVIAHNHVWSSTINSGPGELKFISMPTLNSTISGDRKFKACVDMSSRRTKLLGLNVHPTRIWRKDAAIVLSAIYKLMLSIENVDRNYCYVSHLHLQLDGQPTSFSNFIQLVEDKCIRDLPQV